MPKKQSTAAQRARTWQAATGEKYTNALRAAQSGRPARFLMAAGCCVAVEALASKVSDEFDQGGVPALLATLEELRGSMWSRSAHYDIFSGHGVVLAVESVCIPLLFRVRVAGVWSEPVLPTAQRRQVRQAIGRLEGVLCEVAAEELRG
ncbi:hypothetical protein ACIRQF_30400 [Streptomyces sp. NPDC101191]|uniref:hypothetical protein n=1 Tax=Streptomyces sp. NPDC101191 TaxID=3366126 RepID=UPI00381F9918